MYVRLVRFSFGPGKQSEAQALADDLGPKIAAQPGCGGVTVFGDHADGEYGLFVQWDSEADANAAASVISPQLAQHLSGNIQGPLNARLFAVLST